MDPCNENVKNENESPTVADEITCDIIIMQMYENN